MTEDALYTVKHWFSNSEDWQKDLFVNLWKNRNLADAQKRTLKLLYKRYHYADSNYSCDINFPSDLDEKNYDNSQTILKSVSHVQGIAALNPTNSLIFEDGLNIIYGPNGSGKSSYVKVLKKAENPKDSTQIISNIFEAKKQTPKATLTFYEDGKETIVNWTSKNEKSFPIRIYDTQVAHRFIEKSTETIYEPKILHIFSDMAIVFENLKKDIENEDKKISVNTSTIPDDLKVTPLYRKFEKLSSEKDISDFIALIDFTSTDDTNLSKLKEAISAQNPQIEKEKIEEKLKIVKDLHESLNKAFVLLDKAKVEIYINKYQEKINLECSFNELFNKFKSISKIKEVGNTEWKDMWKASTSFKGTLKSDYNDTCPLCQQKLSDTAKDLFDNFTKIYSSNLKIRFDSISKAFDKERDTLKDLIENTLNITSIKQSLVTNTFEPDTIKFIISEAEQLYDRAIYLYNNNIIDKLPELPDLKSSEENFSTLESDLFASISILKSLIENYDEQVDRLLSLKCKKWFSEHRDIIDFKLQRIRLAEIKSKLNTITITKTKNTLSAKLITDVYIERFNDELKALNPTRSIKVELIADGKKGKTSHRVSIKGAVENKKTEDILSEGELRVVSIAAFLADLNSINKTQAFIFDDPITSLDHNYEDNVAKILVKLSFERQVIVFTHRIAFAETLHRCLTDYLEENPQLKNTSKDQYIELKQRPMGEPLSHGKYNSLGFIPKLNAIKDEDIPKIKKLEKQNDYDLAESKLKSVCSDMRINIENGIEKLLLNGLITRYSRNVSTQKIRILKIITDEDVQLFDSMMSKYSYFEHSQPTEKPVPLPSIEELEKDVEELITWGQNYKTRINKMEKKK